MNLSKQIEKKWQFIFSLIADMNYILLFKPTFWLYLLEKPGVNSQQLQQNFHVFFFQIFSPFYAISFQIPCYVQPKLYVFSLQLRP